MAQLKISTVYRDPAERTIAGLSAIYADKVKLTGMVRSALRQFLTEKEVTNKVVLLKPNWVTHSRQLDHDLCLRTHDNFVIASLQAVLEMKPAKVIMGDAPIQGCQWERLFGSTFLEQLKALEQSTGISIALKDFRRRILDLSKHQASSDLRPLDEYCIFDLGKDSFLEPVTTAGINKFRVTNYDPDRMNAAHFKESHKYCIVRDFLNADVVISLPKIKTHQKTGITGALKNIVGINGDKDFLPHHRLGGTKSGGDCYPGGSTLRLWSELAMDNANRRQGKKSYQIWQKLSTILWKSSLPRDVHQFSAGWHGNNTTWRMVLDLNRIAAFGKTDGTISTVKQRIILSLCDGIIGGQGNGPLYPDPLALGVIMVSDNAALNDMAVAELMGFGYEQFPLLLEAEKSFLDVAREISVNGKVAGLKDLQLNAIITDPPPGWKTYLMESSILQ